MTRHALLRVTAVSAVSAVAMAGVGCSECGTFEYKGMVSAEECGIVYGTEGQWWDERGDADGKGVIVLRFQNDRPVANFSFVHTGGVEATILVDRMARGEALGPEDAEVRCTWWDYGDPRVETDDVYHAEPAADFSLKFVRRGVNLDVTGPPYRRFAWDITCPDDVMRLHGRDVVELTRSENRHQRYEELVEQYGGLDLADPGDAPDTGAP